MPSFAQFELLTADLAAWQETLCAKQQELNEGLAAALTADFKAVFPRRKYTLDRFKECPNGETIHAQFKARADEWYTQVYKPAVDELERQLNAIALACLPDHTPELTMVDRVYAGGYASQGFGCEKYTRQAAENKAEGARFHGFKAEVRPVGERTRDHYGVNYQDYGVFVDCTRAGWELLKRKPAQSLRDWIKSCWQKGTNPRVYNPFLPAGIEEKLGLDYFGNDLAA